MTLLIVMIALATLNESETRIVDLISVFH